MSDTDKQDKTQDSQGAQEQLGAPVDEKPAPQEEPWDLDD